MEPEVIAIITLVLGLGMGLLVAGATYARELRRMARFLRSRDPRSNARLTVNAAAPGLRDLADAVNDELDRAVEERVAAERAQAEFRRDLSALSHDIRTPLTGAKGYLQLAADEPDPAARATRLVAAADRIDATTALLDQLFSYTKACDPELALDIEPVALRPLVESVLFAHYPEFEERGLEPALAFEDDAFTVDADRDALTRIVENLIVNVLRHGDGALKVEQRDRTLAFTNPVDDPAAIDASRLFDRFYQVDAARNSQGSGLGLSVAAALATAMGMRLKAHVEGNALVIELILPPHTN